MCSMFYAIMKHQFKTSKLKNVEKLVKQTVQALKSYWNTGNVHFCTICEIIVPEGGPWKSNVILENSLKNGGNFLYEPWINKPFF